VQAYLEWIAGSQAMSADAIAEALRLPPEQARESLERLVAAGDVRRVRTGDDLWISTS
jgi:predicted ArsR family transcriptional regulator